MPTTRAVRVLAFQRRVVRRRLGLPVEEMPGGHVPMLARPGQLADRLAAISDGGAGPSLPLFSVQTSL